MSWVPLVSTVVGAIIALSGSLLASRFTARDQLSRDREIFRRTVYVDFATALDAAHLALRTVAREDSSGEERRAAANVAVAGSGLHRTREHLLMFGPAAVAGAGESAFKALIDVRQAVRAGADLHSLEYHAAYHAFAEKVWSLRMVVRGDVAEAAFTPRALGRSDWSEVDDCPTCGRRALTQR